MRQSKSGSQAKRKNNEATATKATKGWVEIGVSESPEAAAMDAERAFDRVTGPVLVERESWEDAVKVDWYLRSRPGAKPVRLSPMTETPEEWTAAVRENPRCIHIYVERRCVVCRKAAMGGCFSDGVQEWPVCMEHRDSLAESLEMEVAQ